MCGDRERCASEPKGERWDLFAVQKSRRWRLRGVPNSPSHLERHGHNIRQRRSRLVAVPRKYSDPAPSWQEVYNGPLPVILVLCDEIASCSEAFAHLWVNVAVSGLGSGDLTLFGSVFPSAGRLFVV